jgi:3-hydroxymyristoyl/3-hydroxydecanoyl-(acyl carrier protein) dehydratase
MKPSHDWTVAEWDVDPTAWFFAAAKTRSIPFAVLLEAALQPCGFVSCAIGSPLQGDGLYYRNLGGAATLHFEPRSDIGTITARARLDSHSEAGGMMLQRFTMDLHADGRLLYSGTTEFGFFPPAAMRDQVGLRGAYRWSPERPGPALAIAPTGPEDPGSSAAAGLPHDEVLTLPSPVWIMVDRIDQFLPDGGPKGLGFVRGSLTVDPDAWYFEAHFFQDPVIPGSLGLESFLQLLQVAALARWPHLVASHRFEPIAVGREHRWQYRGQVVPGQERVQIDCWVDAVDEGDEPVLTGSGLLSVDGRDIYSMSGFALRLVRNA